MEKSKVSPQEIYEVLEEKNKLQELKAHLNNLLDKVNQSINSLTVENLVLNQSIALSDDEEVMETPVSTVNSPPIQLHTYNQQEQSDIINQQMIEIDIKPCFLDEEIDSDEEIDKL